MGVSTLAFFLVATIAGVLSGVESCIIIGFLKRRFNEFMDWKEGVQNENQTYDAPKNKPEEKQQKPKNANRPPEIPHRIQLDMDFSEVRNSK